MYLNLDDSLPDIPVLLPKKIVCSVKPRLRTIDDAGETEVEWVEKIVKDSIIDIKKYSYRIML